MVWPLQTASLWARTRPFLDGSVDGLSADDDADTASVAASDCGAMSEVSAASSHVPNHPLLHRTTRVSETTFCQPSVPPATFGLSALDQSNLDEEFVTSTAQAHAEMQRTARLLDHRAAVLIAGSAGMPNVNTVWVDCSPNRAWLDQLDERRLMKLAYDVADGRGDQVRRLNHVMSDAPNVPPAVGNAREVSHEVMAVLKQFRQELIRSHVVCLSPVAEAVMVELASELQERIKWTQPVQTDANTGLDLFAKKGINGRIVSAQEYYDQDTHPGAEFNVATVHDRSFTKLLSRVLRRHPNVSNEFCQAVGKLVAYRSAVQHGSAVTRLRLLEMRSESIRERRKCLDWFQHADRVQAVQGLVNKCAARPWMYALSFDWVTLALRELDLAQKGPEGLLAAIELPPGSAPGSPAAGPAAGGPTRPRRRHGAASGTTRTLACPYKVRG